MKKSITIVSMLLLAFTLLISSCGASGKSGKTGGKGGCGCKGMVGY
jgi:hypothetical protein